MKCEICGSEMQFICYEFACPQCYKNDLMAQDIKTMRPSEGEIISVYDESKHREILKVKR